MIFMFVAPALLRLTDTTIDEHINGNPGCKVEMIVWVNYIFFPFCKVCGSVEVFLHSMIYTLNNSAPKAEITICITFQDI
jgi:hypothetical protein